VGGVTGRLLLLFGDGGDFGDASFLLPLFFDFFNRGWSMLPFLLPVMGFSFLFGNVLPVLPSTAFELVNATSTSSNSGAVAVILRTMA